MYSLSLLPRFDHQHVFAVGADLALPAVYRAVHRDDIHATGVATFDQLLR
jgi:hypothetical protein